MKYTEDQKLQITRQALDLLGEWSKANLVSTGPWPESCLVFSVAATIVSIHLLQMSNDEELSMEQLQKQVELLMHVGQKIGNKMVEDAEAEVPPCAN